MFGGSSLLLFILYYSALMSMNANIPMLAVLGLYAQMLLEEKNARVHQVMKEILTRQDVTMLMNVADRHRFVEEMPSAPTSKVDFVARVHLVS